MSAQMKSEVELVNIEIDGVAMQAPKGSMIIEAADKAGIDIPRFCYHKNLSIAANCRMCLVDVEKAPKPLPACATPVMDGMKVFTESRRAVDAQHGVMEFLLINHPLDCPICDQGGECELQDLAMGYGRSVSRFTERKRVVKDKNIGPLVQTDMTRCIHCTRCVRFLEEIAGTSELGGIGRGERTEIGPYIERSIESELSGNVIDLCPVGALTNKPFRFSARAWELVAQPSVAVHDGVGSNLYYHNRRGKILRCVPRENSQANETWLADRDRYSHFGLYAEDRLTQPQIKRNGEWKTVSWDEALSAAAKALQSIIEFDGAGELGLLLSPSAFNEEYYLARKIADGLGCGNIDHRLRQGDFRDNACAAEFSLPVADMSAADAVLLVGSNIRHEAPILGHKVRQAGLAGAAISVINPVAYNNHFPIAESRIVAPQQMTGELAAVAAAVRDQAEASVPESIAELLQQARPEDGHQAMAQQLSKAESGLILLGQIVAAHHDGAALRALAAYIAEQTGAKLNILGFGGNALGAARADAAPVDGLNAAAMLEQPRKAYLLWDFEPDFDTVNPAAAMKALEQATHVVAVSSFATDSLKSVAEVLLPLAPAAESEGSLTSLSGFSQTLRPAGKAQGFAKPGWKILRQLAHQLGLDGFDYLNLAEVTAANNESTMPSHTAEFTAAATAEDKQLYRIGEVPMYSVDALCRRAQPLQQSPHGDNHFAALNPEDAASLGLAADDRVVVTQGGASVEFPLRLSSDVAKGGVWLPAAGCAARVLAEAYGPLSLEKAK